MPAKAGIHVLLRVSRKDVDGIETRARPSFERLTNDGNWVNPISGDRPGMTAKSGRGYAVHAHAAMSTRAIATGPLTGRCVSDILPAEVIA
jgi:hypothetical protein